MVRTALVNTFNGSSPAYSCTYLPQAYALLAYDKWMCPIERLYSCPQNAFLGLKAASWGHPVRVVANSGFARTGIKGWILGTPVDLSQSGLDVRNQPSDRIQNIESAHDRGS